MCRARNCWPADVVDHTFFIRKAAIRAGLRAGLISCGSSFRLIDSSFSDSFSGREKGPKKCPPTVRGHFFGPISQSENDSQIDSEIEAHSGPCWMQPVGMYKVRKS